MATPVENYGDLKNLTHDFVIAVAPFTNMV